LIVASLDLGRGFSKEREGNFTPASVAPMCPHYKGDDCFAIRTDRLHREEKVGAILALEDIDG
jgi:hypothetical protein